MYQPTTGIPCHCKRGRQRDNCPECEGAGMRIDFHAIHNARSVTRYVLTQETKHSGRAIFGAAQGRYTYATEAEAQSRLDAIRQNTSRSTLIQVCGGEREADSLAVRAVECWPGHFDPKRTVFID